MERPDLHLVATRKIKHNTCPKSPRRVADAGENTDSELHEVKQSEAWEADYYMKCWNCKTVIGLKKMNQVS